MAHLNVEDILKQNNLTLPNAAKPAANYVPWLIEGRQLFISGQLPMQEGKLQYTGHVGRNLSIEDGVAAAQLCALNILAQARAALGNFDKIKQLVKLTGFVQADGGFLSHPEVINGASDLMVKVLSDRGRHARSAVGVASLPRDAAVEIEAIFSITD
jgi:enamine deaminase RidA (YjgF/YER057c/UK114 family)